MYRRLFALFVAALLLPVFANQADARPKKKRSHHSSYSQSDEGSSIGEYGASGYVMKRRGSGRRGTRTARRGTYRSDERMSLGYSNYSSASSSSYEGVGRRPGKWCGWWMRTQRGGGPAYNVAWNWRNYGSAAAPQVGAVVVWRHHVGQIVGQAENGRWIVQSGNDGGRVRSRARSISGALVRM